MEQAPDKNIQCQETRLNRLTTKEDGLPCVMPIISLRNRPNHMGITFKYGKRAGTLKPYKHKDCNEI